MASKKEILETLGMLAGMAAAEGAQSLAEDLNDLIAKHEGQPADLTPPAPVAPAQPEAVAVQPEPVSEPVIEQPEAVVPVADNDLDAELAGLMNEVFGNADPNIEALGALGDNADADPFGGALEAEINAVGAAVEQAAAPRAITLTITGAAVERELAVEIAEGLLPTLTDAAGPMEIGNVELGEGGAAVRLDLTEDNDGAMLRGAGQVQNADGTPLHIFEGYWPHGDAELVITGVAAAPEDLDLARQLGYVAPEGEELVLPAAQEGQHAINGVLGLIEEETGIRPVCDSIRITYRRDNEGGAVDLPELTVEQAHQIINHPISQGGLRQMGNLQLLGVEPLIEGDGHQVAEGKVAVFGILEVGRINPAALAMAGAYRGKWNFGGDLGWIVAGAEMVLQDQNVPVM